MVLHGEARKDLKELNETSVGEMHWQLILGGTRSRTTIDADMRTVGVRIPSRQEL